MNENKQGLISRVRVIVNNEDTAIRMYQAVQAAKNTPQYGTLWVKFSDFISDNNISLEQIKRVCEVK